MPLLNTAPCPCGTSLTYETCCQPLHRSRSHAPTAEALMRSRYAAYVLGEIDYLVATTHPSSRSKDIAAAYQTTSDTIQWLSLEVCGTFQGCEQDKTGKVEFKATYRQGGQTSVHHEHSRFKRHGGRWHYTDGAITDQPQV